MSVKVQNDILMLRMFLNTVSNSIINIDSWFISNLLFLNIDKTQFLQLLMKNSKLTDL